MKPVEIFEYKNRWKPGNTVRLHSDLRSKAIDFCKANLMKHQWAICEYTGVYEDTFYFEHFKDALLFKKQWEERFVNQ